MLQNVGAGTHDLGDDASCPAVADVDLVVGAGPHEQDVVGVPDIACLDAQDVVAGSEYASARRVRACVLDRGEDGRTRPAVRRAVRPVDLVRTAERHAAPAGCGVLPHRAIPDRHVAERWRGTVPGLPLDLGDGIRGARAGHVTGEHRRGAGGDERSDREPHLAHAPEDALARVEGDGGDRSPIDRCRGALRRRWDWHPGRVDPPGVEAHAEQHVSGGAVAPARTVERIAKDGQGEADVPVAHGRRRGERERAALVAGRAVADERHPVEGPLPPDHPGVVEVRRRDQLRQNEVVARAADVPPGRGDGGLGNDDRRANLCRHVGTLARFEPIG